MRVRTAVTILLILLLASVTAVNWSLLTTPSELNLLLLKLNAPLGVLMLGLIGALLVFHFVVVVELKTKALLESRKRAKELEKARQVAIEAMSQAKPTDSEALDATKDEIEGVNREKNQELSER